MKKPRKMSVEQVEKIRALKEAGKTSYAIAKELNIPPGVAHYHVKRMQPNTLKLSSVDSTFTDRAGKDETIIRLLKEKIARLDQKKEVLQQLVNQGFE